MNQRTCHRVVYSSFVTGCAALAAACTSGTGSKGTATAKPLGDIAKQATVQPAALIFPRDGNDDLATLDPGTVLVSDWQDGYLRRVMGTTDDSGKLTLQTEQASLTDIIDDGESQAVVDFATMAPMARTWPGVVADTVGTTFDIPLAGKQIYSDEALGLSVKISDGKIQLSPQLDLGIAIKDGTQFHALLSGQMTANLQLVVSCEKAVDKTFEVTLWESPEFSIALPPIGPIPVSAQGKLIVKAALAVTAMGQVTVTMGASATTDLQYGVRYQDGAWQPQGNATANWQATGPTVSTDVEAHATVSLSAGAEIGLYGGLHLLKLGAGGAVGMSVDPYVQFDYPAPSSPWALRAGFKGRYWAGLTILDKEIAGIDQPGDQLFDTGEQIAPAVAMPVPVDAGTCADGVQDGAETDLDCGGAAAGGTCPPCAQGLNCIADSDCVTGACTYGTCIAAIAPTCSDGIHDGDETDVDCGGSCLQCTGYACTADAGCASGACDTTVPGGQCWPPISCYNGVQDANETGIDCGGACAPTLQCADGEKCAWLADCAGWACPGETDLWAATGTCATAPLNCFDCVQDGDETGIDCGGSCAIEPLLVCEGSPPQSKLYSLICPN